MASDNHGFPDDRDLDLQRQTGRLLDVAERLVSWLGSHGSQRGDGDFAIDTEQQFNLLKLRRNIASMYHSSKVPVAAAIYGASQAGKSLFVGRVLEPADRHESPLGKDYQEPPDAYIRELSFDFDINPQSGSNEATALVTRFTTKDRFQSPLPEYSVKVRALSNAEWLRVLARGFHSECRRPDVEWDEARLRRLFEEVYQTYRADEVDREWRMDLLDIYAYMRPRERRTYAVEESMFNSFLSEFPLTETGYVEIAGRMFWDRESFPELTELYNEVRRFLEKLWGAGRDSEGNPRDGMFVHWGALRFLLDSQRTEEYTSERSNWLKNTSIRWSDFRSKVENGWYVLEYRPGAGPPEDRLATIQSAMLEMIIPVIPERLNEDWRSVLHKMDILDLPGMRAGGGDALEGGATRLDSEEARMNA